MTNPFMDPALQPIADRVLAGERLSFDDGVLLYKTRDLLTVGQLANHVRERLNGNRAYFNVNRHLNPSNVCTVDCGLCAFARKPGEEGGWTMTIEEAVATAARGYDGNVRELHIVGGLNPYTPFTYYTDLLRALKQRFPAIHLKAFTMVEIDYLARLAKKPIPETIELLKEAGMDSCPGGGAEIFAPRVHEIICKNKIPGSRWLEIAGMVHAAGLKSNATMLYGHVETDEERIDHLMQLRQQQDRSGGFQCLIPLAFHPENTALASIPPATGVTNLRNIAVSRLMLDNFPHVKAYWIQLGEKVAQVALSYGADDLDGTIYDERITHMAGASTEKGLTRESLVRLIRDAGREPVERDTLYRPIAA